MSMPGFAVFLLLVTSAAETGTVVPEALLGHWVVADSQASPLPESCRRLSLDFSADGTVAGSSGPELFAYKGKSVYRTAGSGYEIHQYDLKFNDKPNCQGKSSDYVSSHFIPDIYVEVNGDRLRFYFWTSSDKLYLDYLRQRD